MTSNETITLNNLDDKPSSSTTVNSTNKKETYRKKGKNNYVDEKSGKKKGKGKSDKKKEVKSDTSTISNTTSSSSSSSSQGNLSVGFKTQTLFLNQSEFAKAMKDRKVSVSTKVDASDRIRFVTTKGLIEFDHASGYDTNPDEGERRRLTYSVTAAFWFCVRTEFGYICMKKKEGGMEKAAALAGIGDLLSSVCRIPSQKQNIFVENFSSKPEGFNPKKLPEDNQKRNLLVKLNLNTAKYYERLRECRVYTKYEPVLYETKIELLAGDNVTSGYCFHYEPTRLTVTKDEKNVDEDVFNTWFYTDLALEGESGGKRYVSIGGVKYFLVPYQVLTMLNSMNLKK